MTYTVKKGDSLSKIGAKFGVKWQDIFKLNTDKIKNPNLIYPGQVIKLPESSKVISQEITQPKKENLPVIITEEMQPSNKILIYSGIALLAFLIIRKMK